MSYFLKRRALSGVSTELPARMPAPYRGRALLGSLGDDATATPGTTLTGPTTLAVPTILDPATAQFQQLVTQQLTQGVELMRTANLTKWLQIAATVSIPVFAAFWKHFFRKGATNIPGVT